MTTYDIETARQLLRSTFRPFQNTPEHAAATVRLVEDLAECLRSEDQESALDKDSRGPFVAWATGKPDRVFHVSANQKNGALTFYLKDYNGLQRVAPKDLDGHFYFDHVRSKVVHDSGGDALAVLVAGSIAYFNQLR